MPLASPPGRPDVVYGFGRIDASGRVGDRATITALGRYAAIQQLPGIGPVLAAVIVAEIGGPAGRGPGPVIPQPCCGPSAGEF